MSDLLEAAAYALLAAAVGLALAGAVCALAFAGAVLWALSILDARR